jgi:hypothetical protein
LEVVKGKDQREIKKLNLKWLLNALNMEKNPKSPERAEQHKIGHRPINKGITNHQSPERAKQKISFNGLRRDGSINRPRTH